MLKIKFIESDLISFPELVSFDLSQKNPFRALSHGNGESKLLKLSNRFLFTQDTNELFGNSYSHLNEAIELKSIIVGPHQKNNEEQLKIGIGFCDETLAIWGNEWFGKKMKKWLNDPHTPGFLKKYYGLDWDLLRNYVDQFRSDIWDSRHPIHRHQLSLLKYGDHKIPILKSRISEENNSLSISIIWNIYNDYLRVFYDHFLTGKEYCKYEDHVTNKRKMLNYERGKIKIGNELFRVFDHSDSYHTLNKKKGEYSSPIKERFDFLLDNVRSSYYVTFESKLKLDISSLQGRTTVNIEEKLIDDKMKKSDQESQILNLSNKLIEMAIMSQIDK